MFKLITQIKKHFFAVFEVKRRRIKVSVLLVVTVGFEDLNSYKLVQVIFLWGRLKITFGGAKKISNICSPLFLYGYITVLHTAM